MKALRIAIVVHGRFHAFDLARELLAIGHDVTVLTNYPRWAAARFGIASERCRSLTSHAVAERVLARLPGGTARTESWRHRWFGRWAARVLAERSWDVVHCWSGVSEELLRSSAIDARCRVLMRGSTHVAEQARLLVEEEARIGTPLDRPSDWMIEREQREYALADRLVVLSSFARASFERHGFGADRVHVLPLGVDVRAFRPSQMDVASRLARIRRGDPLTVAYVGTLSARKGLWDLVATARLCDALPIRFLLVGPRLPETTTLLAGAGSNVTVLDSRSQQDLPAVYREADLFMFPTIEDGFGMVLTQARAAGLPVMCTTNCAGPDMLIEGKDGWVMPIRTPQAFADRLAWCHNRREDLAGMIEAMQDAVPSDWSDVARTFAREAQHWLPSRASAGDA